MGLSSVPRFIVSPLNQEPSRPLARWRNGSATNQPRAGFYEPLRTQFRISQSPNPHGKAHKKAHTPIGTQTKYASRVRTEIEVSAAKLATELAPEATIKTGAEQVLPSRKSALQSAEKSAIPEPHIERDRRFPAGARQPVSRARYPQKPAR